MGLSNECFAKGQYEEAFKMSSKYLTISEHSGIKENPNYSDALMTQAMCIMILDNDINKFDSLSSKALDFEWDRHECSDYYGELLENRSDGFLFFLRRNLNNIDNTNTCLQLLNAKHINCYSDSISKQLIRESSKIILNKKDIYSLYNKALSSYSDDKYELCYGFAQELKELLESISLINNSLYSECIQIIGVSSLLLKSDFPVFIECLEYAIKLEYDLLGLNYYWFLQCYADGITKHSKNTGFPENLNLLKKAIDIYEVLPDNEESGYRHALSDLSVCYSNIDITQSIRLAEKALSIHRQIADSDTIAIYSNLCDFYAESGQYDKAVEYGFTVLEKRQKSSDQEGLRLIYKRMAHIFALRGDFEEAIKYAEKSLTLSDSKSKTKYAEILNNLGSYYVGIHNYSKGKQYLLDSYKYEESETNTFNLTGLYAKLNAQDSCSFYMKRNREIVIDDFFNTYKNLSEKDRFNYLHSQKTYHLLYGPIEYCAEWDMSSLANMAYNCAVQNKCLLNSPFNIENIQAHLNSINLETIKSQLNENEIAIEFWSDRDPQSNSKYIFAFAIKRDWDNAKIIKLLKDDVYRTIRNEIPTREDYLPLYENIWKPILSELEISDGDTLYLSLDDILSQIPIENICGYDWLYIGDKYNIRRVSNTAKINSLNDSCPLISAYLFGGAVNSQISDDSIQEENILASIKRKYLPEINKSFEYLPWSDVEIDNVSTILCNIMPSENVHSMTDSLCTKRYVKQISGNSPSILHFATHGFNISTGVYDSIYSGYDAHLIAMDHTGLVFSNVGSSNNDFLLSASEIAKLDLSTTDLVILSSCNSGKGNFSAHHIDSELIFAFKIAGAKSIIVTLSRIDDAASSFFMKKLYECLTSGMSKYDAFKTAQHSLRISEEFSGFPYWAYFILLD